MLKRFLSAWEELAFAHENVPAPDVEARLRNLYRAAEVLVSGERATLIRRRETLDDQLRAERLED